LFQIKIKTLTGKKIMIDTSSTILKINYVVKGSWKLTARDIVFSNNEVSCYLENIHGKLIYNKLKFNPNYEYENINGNFYTRYNLKDVNLEIPKKIYQTHKSFEYIMSKFETKASYFSWKNNKDFEYYFFDNNDCEKFIKENFDENVYKAYIKLPLNVMKADLWRYCVIYINGGIYADMDAICLDNPNIFLKKSLLVLAPENDVHLCNWTFAAPPLSPILKTIIDESVNIILNTEDFRSLGESFIHIVTGPDVYTKGIEKYLRNLDLVTYENKKYYENYNDNLLYVFKYYDFHNNIIQHLFTGQHEDGWCKERQNYLKNEQ
jgi:mannosyltransferase OCH1-like enzyme